MYGAKFEPGEILMGFHDGRVCYCVSLAVVEDESVLCHQCDRELTIVWIEDAEIERTCECDVLFRLSEKSQ